VTAFSIDNNIPIPNVYPFGGLKVGDSMAIPFETINKRQSIKAAAHQWAKRHGMMFVTRTIGNEIRIWRAK
jgi:Ni,Fe-hydrogenase maturation factor